VLPLVGSTIIESGLRTPLCSASSINARAILSLTLDPGLKYSSLAKMLASPPASNL